VVHVPSLRGPGATLDGRRPVDQSVQTWTYHLADTAGYYEWWDKLLARKALARLTTPPST
jgi:hypothetical protein